MKTYTLNRISLFLGDTNCMRPWGERVLIVFAQQVHELVPILANELRNLGITGGNLLKNGLKHRGVLLDQLTELLEMRVVAKEFEVWEAFSSRTSSTNSAANTLIPRALSATSLGSSFE